MSRLTSHDQMMFEAIGLAADEERLYQFILDRPGSPLTHLTEAVGSTRRKTLEALTSLEGKGLISRSPSKPNGFSAAPPEVAIEALILRRQEELERCRLAAIDLGKKSRATKEVNTLDVVDIVVGREAVAQRYEQMLRTAKDDVLVFVKPPYAVSLGESEQDESGLPKRGVQSRCIYDRSALELPGGIDRIERLVSAGEKARVYPAVPMKLAIADHQTGLVPLRLDEPGTEGGLILHSSPLLEALVSLFEMVWDRAVPFESIASIDPDAEGHGLAPKDERLLLLLAAGMKDAMIARQLGIGLSTVLRRVRKMMNELEATSRFQAGVQAALRGWIKRE